ncbi:MAG: ATP-binding protein, partial [Xanthomonadaceae bacterium]|nr:ATP-binding protein [Xanthomonadaceae bacterium]
PIGGLGILLMKELADELSWQRHGDENRLTITFAKHHVQ